VPSDFPNTPPTGPHVSPHIHAICQGGVHPAGGIHQQHAVPFQPRLEGNGNIGHAPFPLGRGTKDGSCLHEPYLASMGYPMSRASHSTAMTGAIDARAREHLLRRDGQEDICFGLWFPSAGRSRTSALIHKLLLPLSGERTVHGNVSFNPAFLERALAEATACGQGCSVAQPSSRSALARNEP